MPSFLSAFHQVYFENFFWLSIVIWIWSNKRPGPCFSTKLSPWVSGNDWELAVQAQEGKQNFIMRHDRIVDYGLQWHEKLALSYKSMDIFKEKGATWIHQRTHAAKLSLLVIGNSIPEANLTSFAWAHNRLPYQNSVGIVFGYPLVFN